MTAQLVFNIPCNTNAMTGRLSSGELPFIECREMVERRGLILPLCWISVPKSFLTRHLWLYLDAGSVH
jgi:hypothetical protein